jgi:membrane protein YdbS with pleckstrin-like domain
MLVSVFTHARKDMKYPSAISPTITAIVLLTLAATFYFIVIIDVLMAFVLLMPVLLFYVYLARTTYYLIDDNTLTVRAGFIVNTRIPVNTITEIKPSNNPLSAPAMSLDRLEIRYGSKDLIVVSPKDRQNFVEHLVRLHPDIVLKGNLQTK